MDTALQVSRNLFQYFAADSEIVDVSGNGGCGEYNTIKISLGKDSIRNTSVTTASAIGLVEDEGVYICRPNGKNRLFKYQEGLGAIFLRPKDVDMLELAVWGFDAVGLRQAARLLPMLTGVGQPDFVIVSKKCAWEGAAGVLAMGSFDNFWKVAEGSFVS